MAGKLGAQQSLLKRHQYPLWLELPHTNYMTARFNTKECKRACVERWGRIVSPTISGYVRLILDMADKYRWDGKVGAKGGEGG